MSKKQATERLLVACHAGNYHPTRGVSGCLMDGTVLVLAADGPHASEAFASDSCNWEAMINPEQCGNPKGGGLWILEGDTSPPQDEDDDTSPVHWEQWRWRRPTVEELAPFLDPLNRDPTLPDMNPDGEPNS